MVFSGLVFISLFLPIVLALYYITPDKFRNYVLLLASLVFYCWGEPKFILIMLLSIIVNYFIGLLVAGGETSKRSRVFLIIGIIFNLSLLGVFKYATFFTGNLKSLLNIPIPVLSIVLPLGISFYTFHALSYVIDTYRGTVKAQKDPMKLALYISLFPQLVAGPIVRYNTIANDLLKREHSITKFGEEPDAFLWDWQRKSFWPINLQFLLTACFRCQQENYLWLLPGSAS